MKVCSLLVYTICCICKYPSVRIKTELKKNILKFGYCKNYKYEGMQEHSFDIFYVVTKFILPTANDLKISALNVNKDYKYFRDTSKSLTEEAKQHVSSLIAYCRNIGTYVHFFPNNK